MASHGTALRLHIFLEAVSNPGTQCGRMDYVNEKYNYKTGNRTRDLPACSEVPQPTAPSRINYIFTALNINIMISHVMALC